MPDDASPQRPLPESLTRFLSAPAPKGPAKVPPSKAPEARPLPRLRPPETSGARSPAPNRAMPIFLAWALAYNVLGFAILVLLWRSMG